jgi:hypothetical protein
MRPRAPWGRPQCAGASGGRRHRAPRTWVAGRVGDGRGRARRGGARDPTASVAREPPTASLRREEKVCAEIASTVLCAPYDGADGRDALTAG